MNCAHWIARGSWTGCLALHSGQTKTGCLPYLSALAAVEQRFRVLWMLNIIFGGLMHGVKNKRKNTRSAVWEDITATLEVDDPFDPRGRTRLTVKGRVKDIGAEGMFFISSENIPVDAKAEIVIDFNPGQPGAWTVAAKGKTVRKAPEGVGIRFSSIDLRKMQRCIMERMNHS